MMFNLLIAFDGVLRSYEPEDVKEWVNSYSYSLKGFTPNRGQVITDKGKEAKEVIFYTRNGNLTAYITEKGISYVMYTKDSYSRIDYELIGSNIDRSKVEYYEDLPGYENFYLGHCPDGILFVKSYRKVVIKEVYPNINWVFRYDEYGNLHHEFEIKKGGEIADIRIRVKYADLEIKDNEIVMKTPKGLLIDGNLVAYEGDKKLEANYELKYEDIGFVVYGYSGKDDLVIDPQLVWSTYYGGSDNDKAYSISTDNNSNVYVVGETNSANFPTFNPGGGAYFQGSNAGNGDAFILKFNSTGVRIWATYYGGTNSEMAYSISIDNSNNVYVVGQTSSGNLPTYNPGGGAYFQGNIGGFVDVFILKFNSSGIRLWATFYGGNDNDRAYSVSTDNNNNAYVVGLTESNNFPTQDLQGAYFQENNAGYEDAFILKFNSNGARLWATFYGGDYYDGAFSISIDNNNNVYVAGWTESDNFPTYNPGGGAYFQGSRAGFKDAFILKFNSGGARLWATYYGGSSHDIPRSIFIDNNNNVYLVGETKSNDLPTYNPGGGAYFQGSRADYDDAFILKFNSSGVRQWATYYGGSEDDRAHSISTDNNNNVYVVGWTISDNFPIYNPGGGAYFQGSRAGFEDAFILKFNSNGVRLWATFYGGDSSDIAYSVFLDNNNNVYVVGETKSIYFPTHNPGGGVYFQGSYAGGGDAFISKFAPISSTKENKSKIYDMVKIKNNKIILNVQESMRLALRIYTINGMKKKEINLGKLNIEMHEVSIEDLKKGIYLMEVILKDKKEIISLIKN